MLAVKSSLSPPFPEIALNGEELPYPPPPPQPQPPVTDGNDSGVQKDKRLTFCRVDAPEPHSPSPDPHTLPPCNEPSGFPEALKTRTNFLANPILAQGQILSYWVLSPSLPASSPFPASPPSLKVFPKMHSLSKLQAPKFLF